MKLWEGTTSLFKKAASGELSKTLRKETLNLQTDRNFGIMFLGTRSDLGEDFSYYSKRAALYAGEIIGDAVHFVAVLRNDKG